jgi:NAD-dependent SIR2 family protein deacetylase
MTTPRTASLLHARAIVPPHISKVVLTGAGFSVDAGLPVTNDLIHRARQRLNPKSRDTFEAALDAYTVALLGKSVWKDEAIEVLLTRRSVLKMYHSDFASLPGDPPREHDYLKQIYPLERGIYFLMWLALQPPSTPPLLDSYDRFLARLGNDVAFATLNYDLLLEAIFERSERAWHYPFEGVTRFYNELRYGENFYASVEDDPHPILYVKLHGSFNWRYCWRCDYFRVVRDEWSGVSGFYMPGQGWVTNPGILACAEDNCVIASGPEVGQATLNPLIIPPTHIKEYSRTPIAWQWLRFDELLRQAKQLIFVGTSLRDEDVPLFMALKYLRRKNPQLTKLIVINLDPEAASKAEMWTEVKPTWYPCLREYLANE